MLSCVETASVDVLIGADGHVAALMNSCLGDRAVAEIAVVVHNLCGWLVEGAAL